MITVEVMISRTGTSSAQRVAEALVMSQSVTTPIRAPASETTASISLGSAINIRAASRTVLSAGICSNGSIISVMERYRSEEAMRLMLICFIRTRLPGFHITLGRRSQPWKIGSSICRMSNSRTGLFMASMPHFVNSIV